MKKLFFLPVTATIIGVLLMSSFGYSLKPIAHADFDAKWQLTVTGLVEHPLNLNLTDIVSMPQTTVSAQLICVGSPSTVLAGGDWTGVRLWFLLEQAGVLPETVKVAFYAQDGYTTDLTVDMAQRDDVILAYEKDGAPLSETLRLVVPRSWGYKWIAQVSGIELVNYDFLGVYESQGYSDAANINPVAVNQEPPLSSPGINLPPSSSPSPSPSFSPSPSLSPSPSPSPNSSDLSSPVPSQTQSPESDLLSPMDTLYATAAVAAITVVVAVAIALKKRAK